MRWLSYWWCIQCSLPGFQGRCCTTHLSELGETTYTNFGNRICLSLSLSMHPLGFIYTVFQKSHPIYFCDYSVKCWLILIFSVIVQLRKFTAKWRSYIIQFVYEYYWVKKQENSVCFQCCRFVLPSCQFFAAFAKVCSVPADQSSTFVQKFLNKFFLLHNLLNVQIFHQNSIFLAETHIYTKSPNHWHQTVVCHQAMRILVSE